MNPDENRTKPYKSKTRRFDLYYTYKDDSVIYVLRGIRATSPESALFAVKEEQKIPLFIIDVETRKLHKVDPVPVVEVKYAIVP